MGNYVTARSSRTDLAEMLYDCLYRDGKFQPLTWLIILNTIVDAAVIIALTIAV